jgi:hypothetical protein
VESKLINIIVTPCEIDFVSSGNPCPSVSTNRKRGHVVPNDFWTSGVDLNSVKRPSAAPQQAANLKVISSSRLAVPSCLILTSYRTYSMIRNGEEKEGGS